MEDYLASNEMSSNPPIERFKGSDPVYFQQQADLDVIVGLSPNKALQPQNACIAHGDTLVSLYANGT